VSASWQTIATFYERENRNLGRITGISPCWRLYNFTEIYSIGIDHKRPTDHVFSQDAVYRLFWVATETATSHWLLGPNAFIHWSVPKL